MKILLSLSSPREHSLVGRDMHCYMTMLGFEQKENVNSSHCATRLKKKNCHSVVFHVYN